MIVEDVIPARGVKLPTESHPTFKPIRYGC